MLYFKTICVLLFLAPPLWASWNFYDPFPRLNLNLPHSHFLQQPYKHQQPKPEAAKRDRIIEGDRQYHIVVKPATDSSRFTVEFISDHELHIKETFFDWNWMENFNSFHHQFRSHPVAYEETFQLSPTQVDVSGVTAKVTKNGQLVVTIPKLSPPPTPAIKRESRAQPSSPQRNSHQQYQHQQYQQQQCQHEQPQHQSTCQHKQPQQPQQPQQQQPQQHRPQQQRPQQSQQPQQQCQHQRQQRQQPDASSTTFTVVSSFDVPAPKSPSPSNTQPQHPNERHQHQAEQPVQPQPQPQPRWRSTSETAAADSDFDDVLSVGDEVSIEEGYSKSRFASRGYNNPHTGEFQRY